MLIGDGMVATLAILTGLGLRAAQRGDWALFQQNLMSSFLPAWAWVLGGACLFLWLMIWFELRPVTNPPILKPPLMRKPLCGRSAAHARATYYDPPNRIPGARCAKELIGTIRGGL